MPQVANTRKKNNFIVEIDGINQFEVQKFKAPVPEIDRTEHGDTNHPVKTPGLIKFSDASMEKVRPMNGYDGWAWDMLRQAQDAVQGTGGGVNMKRFWRVREQNANGQTICFHEMYGAWVFKVEGGDFDRMSGDNVVQVIGISVDEYQEVPA